MRPYQKKAVDAVAEALERHDRVLLHAPTGAGKTRMAMSFVTLHLRRNAPTMVLWLAPTKELVEQAAADFTTAWRSQGDIDAAVIQWRGGGERFSGGTIIRRNTVLVAGLQMAGQSVSATPWIEQSLLDRVSLVVFDEAHQSVAPTFRELVEDILCGAGVAKRGLLGLSATPGRAAPKETKELVSMYEGRKVTIGDQDNPVLYLVKKGYLANAVVETHGFNGSPAPSGKGGDYSEGELKRLGEDRRRNQQIVDLVHRLFDEGHKRVIAFTPSVDSAEKCAQAMRGRNYPYAHAISGRTPSDIRDHYTSTFQIPVGESPDPQALFNCNVLTAGFDAPATSAAVIGQPTKSAVRLQQMVGRALRGPKSGGTKEASIHMIVDETHEEFADLAEMFRQWESLWEECDHT